MNIALEETNARFLNTVKEKAVSKPGVKFAIVQPILRPFHQWYMDSIEEFSKRIRDGINTMGCSIVAKIDALIRVSQAFETDGVHLTQASGKFFVNEILFNSSTFFSAIMINLEEEENKETERGMELDGGHRDK
jgi:hypothetical protein